jgi:hypothetical protein
MNIAAKLPQILGKLDLTLLAKHARENPDRNLLSLLPGPLSRVNDIAVRDNFASELSRLATWYACNQGTEEEASLLLSLIVAFCVSSPGQEPSAFVI